MPGYLGTAADREEKGQGGRWVGGCLEETRGDPGKVGFHWGRRHSTRGICLVGSPLPLPTTTTQFYPNNMVTQHHQGSLLSIEPSKVPVQHWV